MYTLSLVWFNKVTKIHPTGWMKKGRGNCRDKINPPINFSPFQKYLHFQFIFNFEKFKTNIIPYSKNINRWRDTSILFEIFKELVIIKAYTKNLRNGEKHISGFPGSQKATTCFSDVSSYVTKAICDVFPTLTAPLYVSFKVIYKVFFYL